MSRLFVRKSGSKPEPLKAVPSRNEAEDLQEILVQNPEILPGDEINPDDPCRWLLIRREMPVPDPGTGENRWSIDVLFADQAAIPTFVECKRFHDTRSRREVVAQMLEYAANAHHYWTAGQLREMAERGPAGTGVDLDAELRRVLADNEPDVTSYFENVEANLREGQLRLVFFLDEAPWELKSIVDFLNRQMERSEVLIVEARQYEMDGHRIISPSLFGYTEQARQIKRKVARPAASGQRHKWTEKEVMDALRDTSGDRVCDAVAPLFRLPEHTSYVLRPGTGVVRGSLSLALPGVSSKSLLTVYTDGRLMLNFAWFDTTDDELKLRDTFIAGIRKQTQIPLDEGSEAMVSYPTFPILSIADQLTQLLEVLLELEKQNT